MARAFISAGSNIDPERNVREAVRLLVSEVRVLAISAVYLTEPVDQPAQPSYYNCVIEIETALPPLELKYNVLRRIENALGRMRSSDKFAPRTIDLDLILYGGLTMAEEDLVLPDPDILRRPFLAVALYELAPGLILPGTATPIAEAAKGAQRTQMKQLKSYTDTLRKELHYGFEHREDTKSCS